MTAIRTSRSQQDAPTDWRKRRFVAVMAIYGSAIGAASMIVNLLARTPGTNQPEHLDLVAGLFIYGGGAVIGILVGSLVATAVHFEGHSWPLGIIVWLLLGLAYGLVFALLAGGLSSPLSTLIFDFCRGLVNPMEVLRALSDIAISWPIRAIIGGAPILFSGALAGILFGAGAWVIDRFHSSAHQPTAQYGSWVISILLGLAVLFVVTLAPPTFLAKFG